MNGVSLDTLDAVGLEDPCETSLDGLVLQHKIRSVTTDTSTGCLNLGGAAGASRIRDARSGRILRG